MTNLNLKGKKSTSLRRTQMDEHCVYLSITKQEIETNLKEKKNRRVLEELKWMNQICAITCLYRLRF